MAIHPAAQPPDMGAPACGAGLHALPADGFGRAVARHIGLSDAPALVSFPARGARLGVARLCCGAQRPHNPTTIPAEDSFVVILQLADYRHHALWHRRGRPILAPLQPKDSITIINLMEDVSANVASPLDALSFHIPRDTLNRFTDEAECARVDELCCAPALVDTVLACLGAAMLPALAEPAAINALFVDRIGLALQAHLATTYGGMKRPLHIAGGLTPGQEARAKQYLVETDATELSLADAAATCRLSRSYFSRAFKASTGKTPHRWLLEHRIEQSKERLRTREAICDIALACGFNDQSHFTRVFTQIAGTSPGAWRRRCG